MALSSNTINAKLVRSGESDKTGTPMARRRTCTALVSIALKMRGEGMGVRASSRVLGKSHSSILRWESRMADQAPGWSPPAWKGKFMQEILQTFPRAPVTSSARANWDHILLVHHHQPAFSVPEHCLPYHQICIKLGKPYLLKQVIDGRAETLQAVPG